MSRRVLQALALLALCGCSTVPEIDGRHADEFTSAEQFQAASDAYQAGDFARAAALADHLLQADFRFADAPRARFLAAEARFRLGEWRPALSHYRRLLDEDPLTPFADEIAARTFSIGKTCVQKPPAWFGDFDDDRDVGIEALTLLVTRFPRCDDADDAWKDLGEAFAEQREHDMAVDAFERLVREFPDSEWADLALYQAAVSYRAMAPGPLFDVDALLIAHAAFTRYLARYPDGNSAVPAAAERAVLEEEVGRRELDVAAYYTQRGSPDGTRLHLANAAQRFPGSVAAAEARAQLAARGWSADGAASTDVLEPRRDRPPWQQAPPGPPAATVPAHPAGSAAPGGRQG
jgi:outer membrane protein assembly factor BamD (BamD/ComL family)